MGTLISAAAAAQTAGFDSDSVGALPSGWRAGVTGRGSPKWTVEADASAPSKPNVLRQSGSGTFPWCVRPDVSLADGWVEVKFKPISGREDQAGGVRWRTLRVEFAGKRIRVIYDGKPAIEMEDAHLSGAGAVGVWTKADSVTLFDDFGYGGK